MDRARLSRVEEWVLLAIRGLHPNGYGVSIRDRIKEATGDELSFGTIYATVERLEAEGLISSRQGEATATRGGRAKLCFKVTGDGERALAATDKASRAMRSTSRLAGAQA